MDFTRRSLKKKKVPGQKFSWGTTQKTMTNGSIWECGLPFNPLTKKKKYHKAYKKFYGIPMPKPIKKVNLTWPQAKKKYPKLHSFKDTDGDGVFNLFDCFPFDKRRQGPSHVYSEEDKKFLRRKKDAERKRKKLGLKISIQEKQKAWREKHGPDPYTGGNGQIHRTLKYLREERVKQKPQITEAYPELQGKPSVKINPLSKKEEKEKTQMYHPSLREKPTRVKQPTQRIKPIESFKRNPLAERANEKRFLDELADQEYKEKKYPEFAKTNLLKEMAKKDYIQGDFKEELLKEPKQHFKDEKETNETEPEEREER